MDRDLASETQAYQALLEGHRARPDDEELYRDMLRARAAMEVASLDATPTDDQRSGVDRGLERGRHGRRAVERSR
jgi:hypothetical protein